ncbi:MAG: phosphatase PAP2 family protein [Alphaproteobacteria bacterium]|nr:phosphatase PAP2 family protein [Alphaproteobacteria bacterium]
MLDILAKACLFVTSEYFVIAFVSVGYLTYKKPIFARALFLLLFTMLLNPYLKSLFEIPLNPCLQKTGWAFPSGHMQTTFSLWGWLIWEIKRKDFALFGVLLITAVGGSLLHFQYHNLLDLGGAVGFGALTLLIYKAACTFLPPKNHPYLGTMMAALGLVLIYLTPENLPHMWIAEGALVGFSLGWGAYHRWDRDSWTFKKRFTVATAFIGIVGLYLATIPLKALISIEGFNFIRFFAVALWVSYGAEAVVHVIHKRTKRL